MVETTLSHIIDYFYRLHTGFWGWTIYFGKRELVRAGRETGTWNINIYIDTVWWILISYLLD